MAFQNSNPTSMFDQGLWDISSTQKHNLGTIRDLSDGRTFAYSQAGGTALIAGTVNQMAVQVSTHLNMAVQAAVAIGATTIPVTLGATNATTAGQYAEGYIYHNKTSVLSQMYKISTNDAAAASATCTVTVADPVRVAFTTSDECTVVKHPQDGVIIFPTTDTRCPTGVAPVAVTAAYYFWNQVKGPCAVLADGTLILGQHVRVSDGTAGSVENLDRDGTAEDEANIGTCINIGTTAETAFIMLAIPGY